MNPFLISIKNCDIESVRRHLNNSAQNNGFSQLFDSHDSEGRTSLHIAAFYGYQEICEVLIENGAPVNAQDFQNNIPIHLAVLKNQINVVELLLNNGSLLDSVNNVFFCISESFFIFFGVFMVLTFCTTPFCCKEQE